MLVRGDAEGQLKLLGALLALSACATTPVKPAAANSEEESCEAPPTLITAAKSLTGPPSVGEDALVVLSAFGIPCEEDLVRLGDRTESEFGTLWTAWCQDVEWLCVHERRHERFGLVLPHKRSTCATGLRDRTLSEIGLHCTKF